MNIEKYEFGGKSDFLIEIFCHLLLNNKELINVIEN